MLKGKTKPQIKPVPEHHSVMVECKCVFLLYVKTVVETVCITRLYLCHLSYCATMASNPLRGIYLQKQEKKNSYKIL